MGKEKKSFEEALGELETIVQELEKGELSLEESIVRFQKGVELSAFCSKKLDETEKKISILIEKENGELAEEEFKADGF